MIELIYNEYFEIVSIDDVFYEYDFKENKK